MINIKKILIPTDFSECSAVAVSYAREFADKFSAKLHLVYVIPDSALILPEGIIPVPSNFPDVKELQAIAKDVLQRQIEEGKLDPNTTTIEVRIGSPAQEIVDAAKDAQADLIVIGTHGRGAVAHFFLGSVAERVVRQAPCPVLTVRPKA